MSSAFRSRLGATGSWAGGYPDSISMHPLLGEVLDALGAHFASYFRLRFKNRFSMDFLSILDGFGEDFGRPNSLKN